jgi:L-ascorbate metabolism protein UlaG (beta-lactamase superfamily)
VTKYHQSCLLLEDHGARVLIDPGVFTFRELTVADLGQVDAVLYTHRHGDHLDVARAAEFAAAGAVLHGNVDVVSALADLEVVELRDGEAREVMGFDVMPRDLPHVVMVDGSPGPHNTGLLLDGRLFHPGDGMALDGLSVEVLAVPIAGPSISNHDAYRFVQQVGASVALPIHYDGFLADPDLFARALDVARAVVLRTGESADL